MRSFTVFALALPAVAFATAVPRDGGDGGGKCNTGPIQCCNQVMQANDPSANILTGLLGVALGSITGLIGVNCSPITVIGAGGVSCTAQTVCCTNNKFNGLIAVGCNPININL